MQCAAHLELPGRTELVQVVLGNLSNLQKPCLSIVIDNGTTLDIGLGLVSDLHDVLGLRVNHGLHNVEVDNSTQIVDVGNENVFLAGGNEFLKKTRVADC